MMLRDFFRLIRVKHYLKNGLIFTPLLFSGKLAESNGFVRTLWASLAFCAVASVVYIINDIRDVDRDRKHPKKKFRPIASGAVSVRQASMFAVLLAIVAFGFGYLSKAGMVTWLLLATYLAINVTYSAGLKNVPLVDVTILAAGFVLRVLFGASVLNIEVSRWLYLTVLAGAFYMGLGKRRGELLTVGTKSRKVNEFYTHSFLDKNMYVCLALTLVFYSLWATDPSRVTHHSLFWTIPIVMVLAMTYSLDVEKDGSMADPVDVLTANRTLTFFTVVYIVLTGFLLYV
jgi:decaprenyl-phosphate phosphoribosyltransferase